MSLFTCKLSYLDKSIKYLCDVPTPSIGSPMEVILQTGHAIFFSFLFTSFQCFLRRTLATLISARYTIFIFEKGIFSQKETLMSGLSPCILDIIRTGKIRQLSHSIQN